MSIFGIILLSLFISVFAFIVFILIAAIINDWDTPERPVVISGVILSVLILIGCTFVGIGMNTEDERIFIAKFNAQKSTIEQSLNSDVLSGLERVQLVNQATELNGELSERKVLYERWHHVCYSDNLYDDVEFIILGEKKMFLSFIVGVAFGAIFVGTIMASSRRAEVTAAYEKGKADERGRILESVEQHFGGDSNG